MSAQATSADRAASASWSSSVARTRTRRSRARAKTSASSSPSARSPSTAHRPRALRIEEWPTDRNKTLSAGALPRDAYAAQRETERAAKKTAKAAVADEDEAEAEAEADGDEEMAEDGDGDDADDDEDDEDEDDDDDDESGDDEDEGEGEEGEGGEAPEDEEAAAAARAKEEAILKLKGDASEGRTLFVRNVPYDADKDTLKEFFAERVGKVESVHVLSAPAFRNFELSRDSESERPHSMMMRGHALTPRVERQGELSAKRTGTLYLPPRYAAPWLSCRGSSVCERGDAVRVPQSSREICCFQKNAAATRRRG